MAGVLRGTPVVAGSTPSNVNTGGTRAVGKVGQVYNLRQVAAEYASSNNDTAIELALRQLYAANPQLKNRSSINGGTLIKLNPQMLSWESARKAYDATPASGIAALSGDQRNAYDAVNGILDGWGLSTLSNDVLKYVQQGYQSDTITYLLSQTDAYKQRFSGNDLRVKAGLAPLSPADYLAAERSYKQVLSQSGLPADFYNSTDDMANLIGSDISPQELQDRTQHAFSYINQIDPSARQAWQNYYGVDDGHLAAYMLDPKNAQATLDKQFNAVDIGASAARQGVSASKTQAENFADMGITAQQALQGYGKVADVRGTEQSIAGLQGTTISDDELANEFVGGIGGQKRKQMNQSESALFAAGSQTSQGSLGAASSY